MNVMKKIVMLTCIICMLLADAARAIANPWLDLTQEELAAQTGVVVRLSEGAENAVYRLLPEMELAEVQYTLGSWRVVFRAMPSEVWEDVSGMYFAPWDAEEPCCIAGADGVVCRDGEGPVSLCLWHDGTRMYAFSLLGEGADAADIAAMAEWSMLHETQNEPE